MLTRENTRQIRVGALSLGGGAPVTVQSMCNTKTWDVESTVRQIRELRAAGCEIVRLAIPNERAALAIDKIKEQVDVPLVADIHFDYRPPGHLSPRVWSSCRRGGVRSWASGPGRGGAGRSEHRRKEGPQAQAAQRKGRV